MKARLIIAATSTALLAGAVWVGGIAQGESGDGSSGGSLPAVEQFVAAGHLGTATLADREAILGILPETSGPIDFGPVAYELRGADEGYVVLSDEASGKRIAAIPTTRGDVCFVSGRGGVDEVASCVQAAPESGVASFVTLMAGEQPDEARGLVAADVTALTVVTDDEVRHPVEIADGAFWWTSPSEDARIVALEAERGGATFTDDFTDAQQATGEPL